MSTPLNAQKAVVIRLVALGLPLAALLIAAGYWLIPPLRGVDSTTDRLVLALRCDAFAALTLLAGIQVVAANRGKSEAINPLAGKDTPVMLVHARYIQNTLEQLVLFVVGTAALATWLSPASAHLLPVLTAVFVLYRLAFWRGYLRDPLLRSFGMAGTFLCNFIAIGGSVYFGLRAALGL